MLAQTSEVLMTMENSELGFNEVDTRNVVENENLKKTVRAPRKLIWEFPLMFFTLIFYLPFWAVGRARDIKSATGNSYKPWLWFFTPLFWVPGVIAYNSMFKELELLQREQNKKSKALPCIWLIFFVLISILFYLERIIIVPIGLDLLLLVLLNLLFGVLHWRFNQWKLKDSRLAFKGKRSGYAWYEWLVLVCVTPFYFFLVYEYGWKVLKTVHLPKYENKQEVVFEKLNARFTVHGDSWKKVDPEDADFKMIGPGDDNAVFVYHYGVSQSVDDTTAGRFDIVTELYDDVTCSEKKTFEHGQLGTRSVMLCSANDWGSDIKLTSVVSQIDSRVIEFVGITMDTQNSLAEELSRQVESMAESFHLLKEVDDE